MKDESPDSGGPMGGATSAPGLPAAVDRATFQAELERQVRPSRHPVTGPDVNR